MLAVSRGHRSHGMDDPWPVGWPHAERHPTELSVVILRLHFEQCLSQMSLERADHLESPRAGIDKQGDFGQSAVVQ